MKKEFEYPELKAGECACYGGIKDVYYIPVEDFEQPKDNGDGTVTIVVRWEENITEDADFEIIDPKQLPPPNDK